MTTGPLQISTKIGIDSIKAAGIEKASEKSRLLPARNGILPEDPWKAFLEIEDKLLHSLDTSMKINTPNNVQKIEIEFRPTELKEARYDEMP